MYAQLGDIIFEGLKGLTSWRAKYAQAIAQHAVLDGKPKLQKTGDALDELTLDMTFHRKFCTPETEIAKLKKAVVDGSVLPLITGMGELVGNFTVSSMDVGIQHTGPGGLIVMSTVSVSLLEAADSDPLGSAITAAKNAAFANASNSPLRNLAIKSIGPGLATVAALKAADSYQEAGQKALATAKVNTPVEASELRKAADAFKRVNDSVNTLQDNITKIRGTVNNLTAIQAAAESVKTYADNTLDAISAGDIDGALAANNDVRQGIMTLTGASSQLIVQTATRRI